jgi:hypothetical protein
MRIFHLIEKTDQESESSEKAHALFISGCVLSCCQYLECFRSWSVIIQAHYITITIHIHFAENNLIEICREIRYCISFIYTSDFITNNIDDYYCPDGYEVTRSMGPQRKEMNMLSIYSGWKMQSRLLSQSEYPHFRGVVRELPAGGSTPNRTRGNCYMCSIYPRHCMVSRIHRCKKIPHTFWPFQHMLSNHTILGFDNPPFF